MWYGNEEALRAELEHRQTMVRAEMARQRWAALARQGRPAPVMAMGRSRRPWWAMFLPRRARDAATTARPLRKAGEPLS